MKRIALLVGLLVVLVSFGCGKKEEVSAPEEKKAPEAAAVPAPEKAAEVAAPAEQKPAEVAPAAPAAPAAVEEKAAEVAPAPAAPAEASAPAVEQKAAEVAAPAAPAAVEEKAAAPAEAAASGDSIVIENSYGKVTFNHKVHSEAFDCKTCHGEGEPAALDMGKDKAHAACKGCHQEKAAGPTKCSECHVK